MFTDISLCPGGAFMQCESVSEFDPNVASPMASEPVQAKIASELKTAGHWYCPVQHLVEKMTDLFEANKALLSTPISTSDPEIVHALCDRIGATARENADRLRTCLIKQGAVTNYMMSNDDWRFEAVIPHVREFVNGMDRIKKNGYDTCNYEYQTLDSLDRCMVARIITNYISLNAGLPEFPLSLDKCMRLGDYEANIPFDSMSDLCNCIFYDRDRMNRLSSTRRTTWPLGEMIKYATIQDHRSGNCYEVCCETGNIGPCVIQYLSKQLRLVMQECYNVQCLLVDHMDDDDESAIRISLRKAISGTVDMFYIGILLAFSEAMYQRMCIESKDVISQYVDTVVTAMKATM